MRISVAAFTGAAQALVDASERAANCRAALGDIELGTLAADIKSLGADAIVELRKRRERNSREVDAARTSASQATNDRTLAEERVRNSKAAFDAAVAARDAALVAFPEGADSALMEARAALMASIREKEHVATDLAFLEQAIEARKRPIDGALSGARTNAARAKTDVETAQAQLTTAKTVHAEEQGLVGKLFEMQHSYGMERIAVLAAIGAASIYAIPSFSRPRANTR